MIFAYDCGMWLANKSNLQLYNLVCFFHTAQKVLCNQSCTCNFCVIHAARATQFTCNSHVHIHVKVVPCESTTCTSLKNNLIFNSQPLTKCFDTKAVPIPTGMWRCCWLVKIKFELYLVLLQYYNLDYHDWLLLNACSIY